MPESDHINRRRHGILTPALVRIEFASRHNPDLRLMMVETTRMTGPQDQAHWAQRHSVP